eukprot:2273626-Alexandrium_andersonii.AAC.1
MWPCTRKWPSQASARNSSGACTGLERRPPAGKPSTRRRWRALASSGVRPAPAASTTRSGT